jgi:Flp pilus assembly protein TadD
MGYRVRGALAVGILSFAGCGAEPQQAPVLTADPPLVSSGRSADDGAAETEMARGTAYVKNEKYAEAKEHFEKAIAIKPTALAYSYVGIADEKLGDRAGAEEAYKNALRLDPAQTEAAQNLAALYLDDPPRPDDAIAVLKPVIARSADNVRLLQNLGYAYGLKGDVDAAGRAYEAALAKGEDAQIRFAYGALLFDAKQPERAAPQLKKALDAAKDDLAMIVSAGRLLGESKAFGDCVRAFDQAIKLKPTEPEFFVRRGTCKHELSDEEGAQRDFEGAIKIDAKFAPAHYYLGRSLLAQNKRQTGIGELEKASTLGGDGPIGKAARAKIDELAQQGIKKKK